MTCGSIYSCLSFLSFFFFSFFRLSFVLFCFVLFCFFFSFLLILGGRTAVDFFNREGVKTKLLGLFVTPCTNFVKACVHSYFAFFKTQVGYLSSGVTEIFVCKQARHSRQLYC